VLIDVPNGYAQTIQNKRFALEPELFQCIYFSLVDDWDGLWRNSQYLFSGLARRGHRVIYFEQPIFMQSWIDSPLSPLHSPVLARKWRIALNGGFFPEQNVHVHPILSRFLPCKSKFRLLSHLDQFFTRHFLTKFASKYLKRNTPIVVWISSPNHLPYVRAFRNVTVVYYVFDDYLNYERFLNHSHRNELVRKHHFLLEHSDLVLCTSEILAKKCSQRAAKIAMVENGVDYAKFNRYQEHQWPVPQEIRHLPRPYFGYIGSLDQDKNDIRLLLALCDAHPEWNIVCVGKQLDFIGKSKLQRPNLHMLPTVHHDQIPSFVNTFDVCLMPHRNTELTRAMSPLKFKEYLAAGKPVVTTDLQWIGSARKLVYPADSPDSFVSQAEKAILKDNPKLKKHRRRWALQEDWSCKVREIQDYVGSVINRKRGRTTHKSYVPETCLKPN
jgi:glycosyltransferase involved in cell wall biosynthesis